MYNAGDKVYVKNKVPFVGVILVDKGYGYEIQVDFDHKLTAPNLTKNVNVYTVPKEWCYKL